MGSVKKKVLCGWHGAAQWLLGTSNFIAKQEWGDRVPEYKTSVDTITEYQCDHYLQCDWQANQCDNFKSVWLPIADTQFLPNSAHILMQLHCIGHPNAHHAAVEKGCISVSFARTPGNGRWGLIPERHLLSGQRLRVFVRIAPGLPQNSKILSGSCI